ncbi:MAG: SAVED domain-containing protein [Candidatus Hodarchaeota archaeon]
MGPPKFFLSYSRKNLDDLRTIARTLMIHGIRIWQDINNLGTGVTEHKIREAIQQMCSGLVFYSTALSVQSSMIRKIELPEAEARHKKDPSFHIVPIFRLSVKETDEALKGCLRIPISNFNGAKVEPKGQVDDVLVAAQEAAKIILNEIEINEIPPLPIGLASKQKTGENVVLDLDFTSFFSNGLPSQEVWDKEFSSALVRVKNALVLKKMAHLRLYSFAHLSLGFLFGYIFRERTGFKLEIEQISDGKREIWSTSALPEENPFEMSVLPGELDSKNLCVKISLMSNDRSSLPSYANKSGFSFRALLELSPPNFPYIISSGQAVEIANQLANKIKQMHAEYGTNTVHIFAAIPLGLALLIGYKLNACGKIQCYEFDNSSLEYSPSCTLD